MTAQTKTGVRDNALAAELARFAATEGLNETPWPGLTVYRADSASTRTPVVYEPCVCFIGRGSKRVHLGEEVVTFDPLRYLVIGVPLPVEGEIVQASAKEPFLSLCLDIDVSLVSEVLLELERLPADEAVRALYVSRMSGDLSGAVLRLLRSLHDTDDVRVLAPLAVRELLYRILRGEQSHHLRSVALRDSRGHRISAVLRYVRENFTRIISVDELAERASMSPSAFHHNFKSMTSLSPLQYLKTLRLHHARRLMLQEGMSAGDASHAVGYNSPSQFSREFKRLFGTPPLRELKRLQNAPSVNSVETV